jgi:hypothetical protein
MAQVIEEPICVRDVELKLKKDDKTATRAFLAVSGEELPIKEQGDYLTVTVPEVNGYQLVVFE